MASEFPATIVSEPPREAAATEQTLSPRQRAAAWRWSPAAAVIWAIFAVGLAAFIAFARVPIGAGWRTGRSMRVLDIWTLFVREVTVAAGPFVTPGLITALVVIILMGCLIGLWLAMSVTSVSPPDRPD